MLSDTGMMQLTYFPPEKNGQVGSAFNQAQIIHL